MAEILIWLIIALAAMAFMVPLVSRIAAATAERRWWRAKAATRRIGLDMLAASDTRRRWR